MKLSEYIEKHFGGSQAAFAAAQGVKRPQVTQWINKGFMVLGDDLVSPRRKLNRQ